MQTYRRHMATQANKRSNKKKANKKEGKYFCEVGEMKMRGKWQIM
jgi:hypothetical protein